MLHNNAYYIDNFKYIYKIIVFSVTFSIILSAVSLTFLFLFVVSPHLFSHKSTPVFLLHLFIHLHLKFIISLFVSVWNFIVHLYYIPFIYLYADEYQFWLHNPAFVNVITVSIEIQLSLLYATFIYLGYISRCGKAEKYGSSTLNILRQLHA